MIENGWLPVLAPEFKKPYYRELYRKVKEEYEHHRVFPDSKELFAAFELTDLPSVRVVILGQDPYHNEGQAHGLCFSVQEGIAPPPSLVNIFQELHDDVCCTIPKSGNLTKWAKEGVLLLNTALTVRAHRANSHKDCGWTWFTDSAIKSPAFTPISVNENSIGVSFKISQSLYRGSKGIASKYRPSLY